MKIRFMATSVAAGALLVAGSAVAAVSFDSTTGEGFVGKGDVQTAFGWNNAQLQEGASGVVWKYEITEQYATVCTYLNNQEATKTQPRQTQADVGSNITYGSRKNNVQAITGFTLTGFGDAQIGEAPYVGQPCVVGGFTGELTAVSEPLRELGTANLFVGLEGDDDSWVIVR